jgi:hypothetical protein
MADEYMELVYRLFYSREPDAIVMDREQGIYADRRKVHPIHFRGRILQVPRAAQHRAVATGSSYMCPRRRITARGAFAA